MCSAMLRNHLKQVLFLVKLAQLLSLPMHYMKYTEPTPVQGEMVTWFGTVLFAVTVTILSSNFQICSSGKMWNFVFIVRHLNCMFQQLIHCKRSHTIVSILHDYILHSMQYHLYEICQSQLKTQFLTVTSCENWGENFNFCFFFFKESRIKFWGMHWHSKNIWRKQFNPLKKNDHTSENVWHITSFMYISHSKYKLLFSVIQLKPDFLYTAIIISQKTSNISSLYTQIFEASRIWDQFVRGTVILNSSHTLLAQLMLL